jgi:hypothetical protein
LSAKGLQFTIAADEVEEFLPRIQKVADGLGGSTAVRLPRPTTAVINLNGAVAVAAIRNYITGTTAHDIRMTSRCWRRSDAFLHALLDGYLAGDGSYEAKNDRWALGFTTNARLADDLRAICARLGLQVRIAPGKTTGFGRTWPIYRGHLRLTSTDHHNARVGTMVVEIRRLARTQAFWDVEVADDPHTFALASGVLTHNSFVLGHSDYHYQHEPIFYGYAPGSGRPGRGDHEGSRWYGDHSQTSVLSFPRPRRSEEHPTMKPEALVSHCLGNSTPVHGIVVDFFAGSGTTMIAAEQTGRRAYCLDVDPRYVQVTIERWQASTGKKAVRT